MKRFVTILLVVMLIFAMSGIAFAAEVVSPEKGNTDVPVDDDPGTKSPQTGETFSVLWAALAAVVLLGAAVFCVKKLAAAK